MASSLNGTGITFSDSSTQSVGTSGNFKFNSGYGSEAISYGCRAWVNFNGTTSPGTIRSSGNVTSVSKTGTGDFTVNYTTAMPDVNYSVTASGMRNIAEGTSAQPLTIRPYHSTVYGDAFTTTSIRLKSTVYSGSVDDPLACSVAIFR